MRTVISEDLYGQVQGDEDGREYVYRKDFVAGGDGTMEFSLSLMYSRKGNLPSKNFFAGKTDFVNPPAGWIAE